MLKERDLALSLPFVVVSSYHFRRNRRYLGPFFSDWNLGPDVHIFFMK